LIKLDGPESVSGSTPIATPLPLSLVAGMYRMVSVNEGEYWVVSDCVK